MSILTKKTSYIFVKNRHYVKHMAYMTLTWNCPTWLMRLKSIILNMINYNYNDTFDDGEIWYVICNPHIKHWINNVLTLMWIH
jgi:hypothetical protein